MKSSITHVSMWVMLFLYRRRRSIVSINISSVAHRQMIVVKYIKSERCGMPSNTIARFGRDFASGKNTERINELCKHEPTALGI